MLLFRRSLETIADPGFGVDVARPPRIGLNFFSQLIDEDAQIFRFLAVIGPPDGLQQAAVSESLPPIGYQLAQQLKLLGGEAYCFAADQNGALFKINFQVS